MSVRTRYLAFAAAILLITCLGVFVLPFLLPPPPVQGMSAANVAGFNNRVAAIAAAVISVSCLLAILRLRLPASLPDQEECAPMSGRFVLGWSLGVSIFMASCVTLVYLSRLRYLYEYGYFLEQMRSVADYHRQLYSQVEFAYGPLLLYPPIWLRGLFSHFRQPLAAAYILTHFLEEFLGCLCLAYVIQRLPIATRLRQWFFASTLCYAFVPTLGLNYAFLRFAAPPALLFFCLRERTLRQAALLVPLGQIVCFGISPEMGFAFACGVLAFVGLRVFYGERAWLAIAPLPFVGTGLFLLLVGGGYFRMLALVSGGLFSLIVEPVPYILLFLIALVWLAPLGVAALLRQYGQKAAIVAGLYVMGLALLPATFGRCDPGHVMFNGLSIYLVALISMSTYRRRVQYGWAAAMVVVMILSLAVLVRFLGPSMQSVVTVEMLRGAPAGVRRFALRFHHSSNPQVETMMASEHPDMDGPPFDMAQLKSIVGNAGVSTPFEISTGLEDDLKKQGMYRPSFYCFLEGILESKGEKRKIAEMNAERWALIPAGPIPTFHEDVKSTAVLIGLSLPYHDRRTPYTYDQLMFDNVAKNWTPVRTIDGYTLYQRRW